MARYVRRNGIVLMMITRRSQNILKVQVITLPTWKWMLNRKKDFTCQVCLMKILQCYQSFPSGKEHQYTNAYVGSISTKKCVYV